ncbi:hypothetical protein NFI96_009211 [Prochilodus magdalenae]|nr:hypothetical protein NFI96_009211 [Prochilodus magdalenae]
MRNQCFGTLTERGVGTLCFTKKTVNCCRIDKMFWKTFLIPTVEEQFGEEEIIFQQAFMYPHSDGISQQDNAPCHRVQVVQNWLEERSIITLTSLTHKVTPNTFTGVGVPTPSLKVMWECVVLLLWCVCVRVRVHSSVQRNQLEKPGHHTADVAVTSLCYQLYKESGVRAPSEQARGHRGKESLRQFNRKTTREEPRLKRGTHPPLINTRSRPAQLQYRCITAPLQQPHSESSSSDAIFMPWPLYQNPPPVVPPNKVGVSNKVASEWKYKVGVSNKVASEWKQKVGVFNKVASEWRHKVGVSNKVASEWRHKVGVSNKVASEWRHKVGVSNKVASEWKHKVGVSNKVASEWRHKVGVSNKVASEWRHKVGVSNKVASEWRHKVGVSNKVASEWRHKVGVSNKVASEWRHKVGVSNKVASEWKHKVGVSNKVASKWRHKTRRKSPAEWRDDSDLAAAEWLLCSLH